MTVFALFILLLRSLWSLAFNTTTIESWEVERHETLVRRARVLGGHLDGPGGIKMRIKKQEFPYDIGIWSNIKQGMGGSANVSPPLLLKPKIPTYASHRFSAGSGPLLPLLTVTQAGSLKRMDSKVGQSRYLQ